MNPSRQRVYGASVVNGRRERDEDLMLFREMFRRETENNVSLLQPVLEEFDASQGNFPIYKFPSGKRGTRQDSLATDNGKNDYDWLKTPPATPLFPSLEMEVNDPRMVVQKELPILEPPHKPSRFSGKLEDSKSVRKSKSPVPSTKSATSSRSVTPNPRPNSSSSGSVSSKVSQPRKLQSQNLNLKPDKKTNNLTRPANISIEKHANSKEGKLRSRGVSPVVRSRLPTTLPGFTDEAPPNLITNAEGRASSATRGRPAVEAGERPRRQSCSPSTVRGRRVGEAIMERRASISVGSGVVVGSRMVEKVMNARRVSGVGVGTNIPMEDKDAMPKSKASEGSTLVVGRVMPRTSFDMAIKHLEAGKGHRGDRVQRQSMVHVKNSTRGYSNKVMSNDSSPQITPSQEIGNPKSRFKAESRNLIVKKGETRLRCALC